MLAQQKAELNLIPGQIPTVINLNQFDILANGLSFTFFKGSESFDISGLTAVIDGHKPDGNVYEYTGTISDNAAVFDITEQMTVSYGKSVCEVRLKDSDGNNIGTANFILHIEQSPLNVPIESTSSFPDIADNVKNSKAYMEKAQASATNAATSEKNAKASETSASESAIASGTSEANAKASEANAKTSETNAANSAASAKTSESNAGKSAAASANSATLSQSWAVGGTSTRDGEDTDNSKYFAAKSQMSAENAATSESNAEKSEKNAKSYMETMEDTTKGLLSTDDTFKWLKAMVYTNNYWAQLRDESGNPILDENSNSILGNWSYIER